MLSKKKSSKIVNLGNSWQKDEMILGNIYVFYVYNYVLCVDLRMDLIFGEGYLFFIYFVSFVSFVFYFKRETNIEIYIYIFMHPFYLTLFFFFSTDQKDSTFLPL